jgi:hypothetical protein
MIAPSGLKTWHAFAFLIVAAAIWHYARGPLIGVGVIVGSLAALGWLSIRFPQSTRFALFVLSALLGGRRRRW